jgi:hypothetical protein
MPPLEVIELEKEGMSLSNHFPPPLPNVVNWHLLVPSNPCPLFGEEEDFITIILIIPPILFIICFRINNRGKRTAANGGGRDFPLPSPFPDANAGTGHCPFPLGQNNSRPSLLSALEGSGGEGISCWKPLNWATVKEKQLTERGKNGFGVGRRQNNGKRGNWRGKEGI